MTKREDKRMYKVDAMIPVWKPDERLRQNVNMLLQQTYEIRRITLVLSIDSTWDGENVENWFQGNEKVQIEKISRQNYNHGGTRHEWAKANTADFMLFLVQDAVPRDTDLVAKLVSSLENPNHAVVYARQIPGFDCDEIETYTRYFNYPPYSLKKTKEKFLRGGVKDCFTSNVCAMYRRDWYEQVGGFERQILLSEDSVYAARVLRLGADVIYNAEAQVIHAHDFGYLVQWKRNFDIGVVHTDHKEILGKLSSEKEGWHLVWGTLCYLIRKKRMTLVPRLFLLSAVKFLAYQSGKCYNKLPLWLVEKCSWDTLYWRRKNHESY